MNILLIENNADNLESMSEALKLNGYRVDGFRDIASALTNLKTKHYDAVISDLDLGEEQRGTDLFSSPLIKKRGIPIIILTGDPEIEASSIENEDIPFVFMKKPADIVSIMTQLSSGHWQTID